MKQSKITDTFPRFVGIGAMKTSSTWISEALRYHPEIHLSNLKELHFFSTNYHLGLDWYLDQTKHEDQHKITGEYSVSYMDDLHYIDRIYEHFPDAKIIISIRNPIERIKSHLKHLLRQETTLQKTYFSKKKLQHSEIIEIIKLYPSLLSKGLYYDSVEYCLKLFGKENLIVLRQEDILNNPEREIKKLYRFLKVDEEFIPYNISSKTSIGIVPRFKFAENLRVRIFKVLKKLNPKIILLIRRIGAGEFYRKINSKKYQELFSQESINYLKNYYQEDYSMTISLIEKYKL